MGSCNGMDLVKKRDDRRAVVTCTEQAELSTG